jgi:arylsulfatase
MYFPDQTSGPPVNREIYIDGKKHAISDPEVGQGEWYSADLFVDYSIRYIDEARAKNKPFVLYLPFINAHAPLMAPQDEIARFKGHYMQGWDALRQARFARQKALGIFGPQEVLPPREPNAYNWDKLTPEQKTYFDTIMSIYAADIAHMDKSIGRLVAHLKSIGAFDNTLILIMSDNGANAEAGPDGELEGDQPGGPHSTVAEGMEWATLSNTPFRYFKHFTEEGGISTPLIAHWPRGINPSLNGSYVRDMGHLIDVSATLLEITGTPYPKSYHGHELVPLQGRSFAATFQGHGLGARSAPLYFEHEGNRAIRTEQWKLVQPWGHPWELYDMTADRSETKDLAAAKPDLAFRMAAQWNDWASKSYVDPWTDHTNSLVFRKGPRQNWGQAGTPKIPQALDKSVTW